MITSPEPQSGATAQRAAIAYPLEYRLTLAAADRHALAIQAAMPTPEQLNEALHRILRTADAPMMKYRALRAFADQIAAVVGANSACAAGCAQCCHIAVSITSVEARLIGREIGRTPAPVKPARLGKKHRQRVLAAHFGQPCTFLEHGRCGIYALRPLACRLHFNIGHSPFFCSAEVRPDESVVPNIDFRAFHAAVLVTLKCTDFADIRQFFPRPSLAASPRVDAAAPHPAKP